MKVLPYVPQPIEIPGNVTEQPYMVRIGFIRRVVALYGASLLLIGAISLLPMALNRLDYVFVFLSLLLLSAGRALAKGRAMEQRLSLLLSITLFLSLGLCFHRISARGWPVWSLGFGCVAMMGYTFLCGRDLSFLGMWILSVLGAFTLSFACGWLVHEQRRDVAFECLLNLCALSYLVYDLAALLTRRRLGEEVGAVLDLYRDVLNMFSYPIRVWKHWHKHKIWSTR